MQAEGAQPPLPNRLDFRRIVSEVVATNFDVAFETKRMPLAVVRAPRTFRRGLAT